MSTQFLTQKIWSFFQWRQRIPSGRGTKVPIRQNKCERKNFLNLFFICVKIFVHHFFFRFGLQFCFGMQIGRYWLVWLHLSRGVRGYFGSSFTALPLVTLQSWSTYFYLTFWLIYSFLVTSFTIWLADVQWAHIFGRRNEL